VIEESGHGRRAKHCKKVTLLISEDSYTQLRMTMKVARNNND
jgi:hypothetical protein